MDRETESILLLAGHTMRFIADHPYAATWMFGAAVGSAVTYKVMTQKRPSMSDIFTPKMYKIELTTGDLRNLLNDPAAEVRWDMPEASVIITSEEEVPLKALPVIEHDESEE